MGNLGLKSGDTGPKFRVAPRTQNALGFPEQPGLKSGHPGGRMCQRIAK